MTERTAKEQLLSDGAFDDLDLMWISQVVEDFVEPRDENLLISATAEALEDLLRDNLEVDEQRNKKGATVGDKAFV